MVPVRKSMWFVAAAAVTVGLLVPSAGWGQAGKEKKETSNAGVEIEEITVTAQKREENIQEIPLSVTALSGEVLATKGIKSIVDIGEAVPNLRIVNNPGTTASTTISMRGLQAADVNLAFQTVVGLYVDGAYISKIAGSNLDLEDLERVEALRGPQGTLYGRNTIAGAVNFITKKPTEERSITLATEAGNFDTFNGRLTFNTPLVGKNGVFQSDALGTISLRENVGYKSHDGYFRNALAAGMPAQPTTSGGSDYNSLHRLYTMTALRWEPTKDITVDYWLEYHRYHNSSMASQLTYAYPAVFGSSLDPYIQLNRSDVTPSTSIFNRDLALHQLGDSGRHIMHNLTAAWDLGDLGPLGKVTVKSISSYRSFLADTDNDFDGTPVHIIDIMQVSDVQHWSEELQWIGTAPRFHYVLGAYYFGEYDMQNEDQVYFGGAANFPSKNFIKTKSYAPYGQITWTPPILSDKLSVTAGVRYTQEQVHLDHIWLNSYGPFTVSTGKAFGGIKGAGAPGLSPMVDLSYQWTDELMTYFRVSRGFRGGGFTPTAPTAELTKTMFKPENLLSYELGFKSQWFDRRLRLNATGFYSDYSDLQETVFRASKDLGAYSFAGNAESAEVWGMEFEGTVVPVRGVEATVGYSFVAPKYLKWIDQQLDANGNPVNINVAGQRSFPDTPHSQLTAGLTYTAPPTTTGTFSAHIDTYWQDRVTFITNNQTPGGQADEGWAYAVVNGRLQFAAIPLQKGSLDLAVFGRNLLDRKYRTFGIDWTSQIGVAADNYGDPRTFGVSLTYNFTAS